MKFTTANSNNRIRTYNSSTLNVRVFPITPCYCVYILRNLAVNTFFVFFKFLEVMYRPILLLCVRFVFYLCFSKYDIANSVMPSINIIGFMDKPFGYYRFELYAFLQSALFLIIAIPLLFLKLFILAIS